MNHTLMRWPFKMITLKQILSKIRPGDTIFICILSAAPWPIHLRKDLLSSRYWAIWHPQPELWALHVWPLNGNLRTSQQESQTPSLSLEPHPRDASIPLSGLFSLPGAQPEAV